MVELYQGKLRLPGIAGYEWVPASEGNFFKTKYFFRNIKRLSKSGKIGTHLNVVLGN